MFKVISHPAGYETVRFVRDGGQYLVLSTVRVLDRITQNSGTMTAEQAARFQAELVAQGYLGR